MALSRASDGDHDIGAHAGAQIGTGLVERDARFEVAIPGRPGGAADVLDVAGERLAGQRDYRDGDLLPLRTRWPRSSSPMLALTSQFFMSGICATAMPARTVSPS